MHFNNYNIAAMPMVVVLVPFPTDTYPLKVSKQQKNM